MGRGLGHGLPVVSAQRVYFARGESGNTGATVLVVFYGASDGQLLFAEWRSLEVEVVGTAGAGADVDSGDHRIGRGFPFFRRCHAGADLGDARARETICAGTSRRARASR